MPIPSGYTSGQVVQAVPIPAGVVQVVASGITSPANKAYRDGDSNGGRSVAGMYLDSPATTSATTYKIQVKKSAGTMVVGATYQGQNNADTFNCLTNITLMEVLA
jgi:hypothetical protein